jgi:septal ring factor EnvC (AmiA/AmiB activator)
MDRLKNKCHVLSLEIERLKQTDIAKSPDLAHAIDTALITALKMDDKCTANNCSHATQVVEIARLLDTDTQNVSTALTSLQEECRKASRDKTNNDGVVSELRDQLIELRKLVHMKDHQISETSRAVDDAQRQIADIEEKYASASAGEGDLEHDCSMLIEQVSKFVYL